MVVGEKNILEILKKCLLMEVEVCAQFSPKVPDEMYPNKLCTLVYISSMQTRSPFVEIAVCLMTINIYSRSCLSK